VRFVLYPLRTGKLYNVVAVFHPDRYTRKAGTFTAIRPSRTSVSHN
jgi:hypothetical protein